MNWTDLTEALDTSCIGTFGISATLHPQSGGSVTVTGIIAPPPMLEEVLPNSSTGVTNVYFFVRFVDISPNPRRGDVLALNGVQYDIQDVLVDSGGGATLKLRRNS